MFRVSECRRQVREDIYRKLTGVSVRVEEDAQRLVPGAPFSEVSGGVAS